MPTIELPDFWLLFDPQGIWDGSVSAISPDGVTIRATAAQAHAHLVPNKRTREADIRKGWTVRAGTREELQNLVAAMRSAREPQSQDRPAVVRESSFPDYDPDTSDGDEFGPLSAGGQG